MKNKRGQISLYMILGLILLFVFGISTYFLSNIRKGGQEAEQKLHET